MEGSVLPYNFRSSIGLCLKQVVPFPFTLVLNGLHWKLQMLLTPWLVEHTFLCAEDWPFFFWTREKLWERNGSNIHVKYSPANFVHAPCKLINYWAHPQQTANLKSLILWPPPANFRGAAKLTRHEEYVHNGMHVTETWDLDDILIPNLVHAQFLGSARRASHHGHYPVGPVPLPARHQLLCGSLPASQ